MAPPGLTIAIEDKRFAGRMPVFSSLQIAIVPCEVLAVLGPSGVGKSTLMRMIAGIDSNFTGSIAVNGVPARNMAAPGFVFQDARLLPWLTAAANIRLAAPQMVDAEVERLLGQVGLAGEGLRYPHQLSGGMQRRVALARALATPSELLLLDEPFASLDAALAADMRGLLARVLAGERRTVVLVTHDPMDAATLADRAIVLGGNPAKIEREARFPAPRLDRDAVLGQYRGLLS